MNTKKFPLFKAIATLQIMLINVCSFTGCATLISGTSQNVAIESEPPKAKVRVETIGGVEVQSGETPMSVSLRRKEEYMVIVGLPGYKEQRIQIRKEFNPVAVLSILAGILGIFVDLATGAAWNLVPERIHVSMQRAAMGYPEIIVKIEYENGLTRVIRKPLEPVGEMSK